MRDCGHLKARAQLLDFFYDELSCWGQGEGPRNHVGEESSVDGPQATACVLQWLSLRPLSCRLPEGICFAMAFGAVMLSLSTNHIQDN